MPRTAAKKAAKKAATAPKPAKRPGVAHKAATTRQTSRAFPTKTTRTGPAAAQQSPVDARELAHSLDALLHTMHTVQQFEETLCSLKHALQRGRPTGALMRELREVLDQLPAHDYLHEVDALRDAVAA